MGQSTTPKALALGVSLSLACGLLPGAAFADEAPEDDASANAADSARGTAGGADSAPSGAAAKPDGYDKPTSTPTTPSRQSHGRWPSRWQPTRSCAASRTR